MRFRGPAVDATVAVTLDAFTAIFHRPSGTTHLLVSPATEILAALTGATCDHAALIERLRQEHDLLDEPELEARLAELVDAGLIAAS